MSNEQQGNTETPDGARAVVEVAPNPTTERNQEVTITGHWGGGSGLRTVHAGLGEHSILEDVRIISSGPERFEAKARLRDGVGYGAGPIVVDCGGQLGVTILVTTLPHE